MNKGNLRKLTIAACIAAFALAVSACETVKGVGKDIQNVGEAGEDAIDGD